MTPASSAPPENSTTSMVNNARGLAPIHRPQAACGRAALVYPLQLTAAAAAAVRGRTHFMHPKVSHLSFRPRSPIRTRTAAPTAQRGRFMLDSCAEFYIRAVSTSTIRGFLIYFYVCVGECIVVDGMW